MPIIGAPSAPAGGTSVPTDGTFANANWVEALYTDHDYTGRTILTNGLLLADLSIATSYIARTYLWSTGLATPAWQKVFDLEYVDNAGNIGTLQSITAIRIGGEESALKTISATSGGKAAQALLRLQRGRYECRADYSPLVEASSTVLSLAMLLPATPKILYNSTATADNVLSETSPAIPTDYGYGAAFIANATYPFIVGFVYQNKAGNSQPYSVGNVATIGLGDNNSLAAGSSTAYGFFAIPYGVNGSYSTANLQAEAESGTLGTGWTSQANAAASAGNEAKVASGTTTGNADTWGTAFVPAPGTYDMRVRVKVTSAAGSSNEMKIGLYNSTDSTYVASTTLKPNQVTTGYAWYTVAAGVTPTAAKSMRFRAETVATIGTDWFIDEAVLLPLTLSGAHNGPQDIAQQFQWDRSTRLVRP